MRKIWGWRRRAAGSSSWGPGLNLRHYPEAVDELVLTEPAAPMVARLKRRVWRSGRDCSVVPAAAEALPFEDDSFDTVVSTLVLCTVADPAAQSRRSPESCARAATSCSSSTSVPTPAGSPAGRTAYTGPGMRSRPAATPTGRLSSCSARARCGSMRSSGTAGAGCRRWSTPSRLDGRRRERRSPAGATE
jgi:Methyltransferase domain